MDECEKELSSATVKRSVLWGKNDYELMLAHFFSGRWIGKHSERYHHEIAQRVEETKRLERFSIPLNTSMVSRVIF